MWDITLLQMSCSGAALILAIIAVRTAAINRLPKKIFLIFWWTALVRLLLPYSVPSVLSVYSLANQSRPMQEVMEQTPVTAFIPSVSAGYAVPGGAPVLVEGGQGNTSVSMWFAVWAIGAVLCGICFFGLYLRCYREFRTALPVFDEYVLQWLKEHGMRRPETAV